MAKKRTMAERAEGRLQAINDGIGGLQAKFRDAEDVLNQEEERALRRQQRRNRQRNEVLKNANARR